MILFISFIPKRSFLNVFPSAALFFSLALLLSAGGASAADRLREFTSDGCSLFPDGSPADRDRWCECCFLHDIAYWKGGSAEDRLLADEALRACVRQQTGNSMLADLMYDGVRVGGHPVFPNWYRWGYGWNYGRGYARLTPQELQTASGKLEHYYKDHPAGYCTSRPR